MEVVILSDKNFKQEVMESKLPVLVDMYSEWCPPCQLMLPIVAEIAEKFSDKIKVGKLNVEENEEIPALYRVEAVPVLYIFKDGEIIHKMVGAVPIEILEEKIKGLDSKIVEKKAVNDLIEEYRKYAADNNFELNSNKDLVESLAKALLTNEKKYGERYCPCRKISGNREEDKKNICPCA